MNDSTPNRGVIPMRKVAFIFILLVPILLSARSASSGAGIRIDGIEYIYSESQGRAFYEASSEAKKLPTTFDIESIYTEAPVLRNDLIEELLSDRGIEFIETKIRRSTSGQTEGYGWLGMSSISGEIGLNVGRQGMDKTYARIELSHSGDSRCMPRASLPRSISDRLDSPPFLPDSCIAVSFIDRPTSRYHLIYESNHKWGPPFGYWSLIDVINGNKLGSITTADSAERPQNGNTGHSFLSWRIRRTPGTFKPGPFLVKQSIVVASPPFLELIAQRGSLPLIQQTAAKTPFTKGEWEAGTYPAALHARWREAVDEARHSGIGHYEGQGAGYRFSPDYQIYAGAHGRGRLLDWGQRNLVGIQLVETATQIKSGIPWDVSASEGGFLVFTTDWGNTRRWGDTRNQIVARYNINGTLDWAVRIPGADITDCGSEPRKAWATDTEIILAQPSCNNKEGTEWRLKKADIPFYKPPTARTSSRKKGDKR
jgi:hypothetical protein